MSKEAPQPQPSADWNLHTGHRERAPKPNQTLESAYHVITSETPLGGAIYPFLEATGRQWSQITHPLAQEIAYPNVATLAMETPTLRWVNGPHVSDVFVDSLTTEQFLTQSGLALSMEKGGYVLSK